jgi:hypothetical protein
MLEKVVLIYLSLSAIATFLAALVLLSCSDASPAAVTHLVFVVGIMPLIVGAITHFVPVLTRSGRAPRSLLLAPLGLQLAGWLAFLDFRGEIPAATAAAIGALVIAAFLAGWLVLRARRTLGRPHPGWRWYLAAVVFLAMALMLVPAMSWWPEARPELRLLHLHLNTLGFVGLTALGTLQVLLPTVLSGPDADAARRLQHDLPCAIAGILMAAAGAAFWLPLALAGAALLAYVGFRILVSWLRRYGARALASDGVAAPLVGAMCGFLLLLVLGMAHGLGILAGRDAVPAFVVAFLLPMVTGALTQLLPVWIHRGKRTPTRERMHAALRRGGVLRALLFGLGGILLGLGISEGIWSAVLGLLSFMIMLIHSLLESSPARDSEHR